MNMIDIKKIFLDLNNPRFVLLNKLDQTIYQEPFYFFLVREKHRKQIIDLLKDILEIGLVYKYFILLKKSDNRYIVLDGNRRIFVLKFLFLEDFRNAIQKFNPNFYQNCMLHFNKHQSKIGSILEEYQTSSPEIIQNYEDAQKTLERLHNNKTEDGKVMRGWPTWETRINQKEPEALFIFSHFKEWGFTIFLENINKKPAFRFTTARDLLKFEPTRKWLHIEKKIDGTFISTNKEETQKKLLTVVYHVLNNPKTKATQFFYKKEFAIATIDKISMKMKISSQYEFTKILDKLDNFKIEEEIRQSETEETTNDNSKLSKLATKIQDKKWFYSVELFEETEKDTKIYNLMQLINKMPTNQLEKMHLLVFMTLRPLIEMVVKEYFFKTKQKNLDPQEYKSKPHVSLQKRVKQIYYQIKQIKTDEGFDLNAIHDLSRYDYINKLNSILHHNSDFTASFEELKNYIKLIDNTIITIKKAIKLHNLSEH